MTKEITAAVAAAGIIGAFTFCFQLNSKFNDFKTKVDGLDKIVGPPGPVQLVQTGTHVVKNPEKLNGPRTWTKRVIFRKPYKSPPSVMVSLSQFSIETGTVEHDLCPGIRAEIESGSVSSEGFNLNVSVIQGKMYETNISWVAFEKQEQP